MLNNMKWWFLGAEVINLKNQSNENNGDKQP